MAGGLSSFLESLHMQERNRAFATKHWIFQHKTCSASCSYCFCKSVIDWEGDAGTDADVAACHAMPWCWRSAMA